MSWSGAHPTGGVVADQNSDNAQHEEYPFVLLECRGDAAANSGADQITPQTCWTQTWDERYQDSLSDVYPPYRLDADATAAQRAQIVGAPSPLPASCALFESAPTQNRVPFVAADGHVYEEGNGGCAPAEAPESDDVGGSALPSNETFGVTDPDGTEQRRVRRMDLGGERVARLLADGGLLTGRHPHHGDQLRPHRGHPGGGRGAVRADGDVHPRAS